MAASLVEMPSRLANAQIGQLGQAGLAGGPAGALGQTAMAPAGGLVNQAVGRLGNLSENGPGWMYYGINAADRGLGYLGSYYTIGGFIPYAEDDLGGIWSADVRTHLSNYGGFFSNVGAVRKQFFGGTLFGVGVFWDYDGDQNQYSDTTITDDSGSYVFAGGQTYQQVGVSAEWLTDYGNLRSNGYIPCGTTAQTMGPFVGNSFLCNTGVNAALAGTDLELGVYMPGLADWAGMVSVGGYAYGNSRYNTINGRDVVPWFGGVYTRLDLTLRRNWDFSLQANNDSFFDWTGFARLTYRMGGSRRRNVPDQMEQPMFRNEHIVRTHQTPEQALIARTPASEAAGMAGKPFKVIHVDSSLSVAPGGNGTWERPVKTLQEAQALAQKEFDIVFVRVGDSLNCPYDTSYLTAGTTGYQFAKDNQYLVGEGTSLQLCTANCGLVPLWTTTSSSQYPVISNPVGPAIVVDKNGTYVDHVKIVGSQVGISDGAGLPAGASATVNDVQIVGTGASQRGVEIVAAGSDGEFDFVNMKLLNLTNDGFYVNGQAGGDPRVNITSSTIENTSGNAVLVDTVLNNGRVRVYNSRIDGTTAAGVSVANANAIVQSSTFRNIGTVGIGVTGGPSVSGTTAIPGTSTVQVTGNYIEAIVGVQGSAPESGDQIYLTINQNRMLSPLGGNGINLAVGAGKIDANIIGNHITGLATTTYSTGSSAGGTAGATFGNPGSLAANIYLTTTNTSAATLNNLTVKAVDLDNLSAINRGAEVVTRPRFNTTVTGTTINPAPPPPPPNYDPTVLVPLPPQ